MVVDTLTLIRYTEYTNGVAGKRLAEVLVIENNRTPWLGRLFSVVLPGLPRYVYRDDRENKRKNFVQ